MAVKKQGAPFNQEPRFPESRSTKIRIRFPARPNGGGEFFSRIGYALLATTHAKTLAWWVT